MHNIFISIFFLKTTTTTFYFKIPISQNITYYKKELFAAVATMIDLEDQHKKKGTHIKKRLKIVVESVGEFLMQDPEESKK